MAQDEAVGAAFAEGNAILSRMRALTVEPGPVEARSVLFSEETVRLANIITRLRQLSVAPLVMRAAQDLSESVVMPQLDSASEATRNGQLATIDSVMLVLSQRATTLQAAAAEVEAMEQPVETVYTPISTADAVIRYAGNFIPSWAGAIAIDLLPAVLVFISMVAQAAIRAGRERISGEDQMTLAELRTAMHALRDVDAAMDRPSPVPVPTEPPLRRPSFSAVETPARPAE